MSANPDNNFNLPSSPGSNLEELISRNIKLNEEILHKVKYIKRYIIWQQIWGWLKFFLILIPLILAAVYLPPLLKQVTDNYNQVMNLGNSLNNINIPAGFKLP